METVLHAEFVVVPISTRWPINNDFIAKYGSRKCNPWLTVLDNEGAIVCSRMPDFDSPGVIQD